jgi:phosphoribosylformylglycinamidine synthase
MSFFRCLPGADALSAFRQQRLLASLAEQGISLSSIQAQYLHFVWSDTALGDAQIVVLEGLLTYGEPFTLAEPKAGWLGSLGKSAKSSQAIAIPRFGTVSPWASKATDIAHQCGLPLLRIERGIQYTWVAQGSLSTQQQQTVLAALHDRMTETVVDSVDAVAPLYQTLEDRPLLRIPVMSEGEAALEKANVELGLALSED